MRTIDVADATTTLSQYATKGLKEALVVTRRRKPLTALTPIKEGDWESLAVATNPEIHGDHRALAGLAQAGDRYLDGRNAPPAGDEAPQVVPLSAVLLRVEAKESPCLPQMAADP